MTKIVEAEPLSSVLSDRHMTFTLTINGADGIAFRSCEIIAKGFRNRVSFAETKMIEDVLVGRLAEAISRCLRDLPAGPQVLALPEFLVELPGLALYGLRVMVQEANSGVRSAILRFKEFMGALNCAFLMDIGIQEPFAAHAEKLAVSVLAEVCLPILNLSHSLNQLGLTADKHKMPDLSEKLREFEFQTELLKRFIYNAGIGHAEPPGSYLFQEHHAQGKLLTRPV